MSDVKVDFLHPTDGRLLTVTVDDTMTAAEAISELIANDFIFSDQTDWKLVIKGGQVLPAYKSFLKAGVKDNDILCIISVSSSRVKRKTESVTYSAVPGLQKRSTDKFIVEDIQKSPVALIIIINMLDDLTLKFENQAKELEKEKMKSHSRLIATILLLVSQFIIAIGVNLLAAANSIAIPVLVAGGIQAGLSIFLTFRNPK